MCPTEIAAFLTSLPATTTAELQRLPKELLGQMAAVNAPEAIAEIAAQRGPGEGRAGFDDRPIGHVEVVGRLFFKEGSTPPGGGAWVPRHTFGQNWPK